MRSAWASLACMILTSVAAQASDIPVVKNVDRRIPKEPEYVAERPLYGLLVFGPSARERIWMVLDHSKRDADSYDILYVDLNANGDLSEPAERLVGQVERSDIRFHLPDLKDPVTGAIHTHFTVRVSSAQAPTVMVSVVWRGRFKMGEGILRNRTAEDT